MSEEQVSPMTRFEKLGRGINFGNCLESPIEGEWGMRLEERFFDLVKAAGFATVRLPVRWSAHAEQTAPYTIQDGFFSRIDWALRCATQRGLHLVLNIHHYEELMKDFAHHRGRFLGLWKQIAEHYREQPASVLFELCNEPFDIPFDDWNELVAEAVALIRRSNGERILIVSGVSSGTIEGLRRLSLPREDPRLMATFHYYEPFTFTHQDAYWVSGSSAWLGTHWSGTAEQKTSITTDFEIVERWRAENKVEVLLGEFGAYSHADMASRVGWTAFVTGEAERRSIPWAYWEFGAGFGVYDRETDTWRVPLLSALTSMLPSERL